MANVLKMEQQALIRGLLELGWSYRRIERETGVRRETIARYDPKHPRYGGAQAPGPNAAKVPTDPDAPGGQNRPKCPPSSPADAAPKPARDRRPTRTSNAAPFEPVIRRKLKAGLSAQRIYQDLVIEEGYQHGYDSVKRLVRRLKQKAPEVFARIHTGPGEEVQVDFGEGAPTLKNGRYVRPWLFKMVLSYSRHSYEEVVWGQDVETFIRCHERAFEALGGVVRVVVIDNLKSGVLKANLYEPELNPAYAAYARHAGFVPLPCLPGKPEHKGKTESGIGYTQDNALKGLRFDSLEAQNAHLRHWNRTWARTRIHGTTKRQVYAVFLEEERAALKPAPLAAFAYFKVGRRKVHQDGHVEVQRAYYSVPHRFVGETVTVHFNRDYVKVFDKPGNVIAYHRTGEPGRFRTETHHLPERKSYSRKTFKTHLLLRLQQIGPYCRRWAEEVLKERDALGLRALQGVVHLKRKYAPERIEEACRMALHLGSLRYNTVARLCEDGEEDAAARASGLLHEHPALRPLSEYQLFLDGLDDEDSASTNRAVANRTTQQR